MLLIGICPITTDLPPVYMSVEGVKTLADHGGGLYVGEADVAMLLPDAEIIADDEGNLSILHTDLGETQGILDDDGYLVWAVTALPGFVSVAVVPDAVSEAVDPDVVRMSDIDGDDIVAQVDHVADVEHVVVTIENDGGAGFTSVILPIAVWRAFSAAVDRLLD